MTSENPKRCDSVGKDDFENPGRRNSVDKADFENPEGRNSVGKADFENPNRIKQLVNDITEIGENLMIKLDNQGEQIKRSDKSIDKIMVYTEKSKRLFRSIGSFLSIPGLKSKGKITDKTVDESVDNIENTSHVDETLKTVYDQDLNDLEKDIHRIKNMAISMNQTLISQNSDLDIITDKTDNMTHEIENLTKKIKIFLKR